MTDAAATEDDTTLEGRTLRALSALAQAAEVRARVIEDDVHTPDAYDPDEPLFGARYRNAARAKGEKAALPPRPDGAAVALLLARAVDADPHLLAALRTGTPTVIVGVPTADWVLPVRRAVRVVLSNAWSEVIDAEHVHDGHRVSPPSAIAWTRSGDGDDHTPEDGNEQVALAALVPAALIGIAPSPERHLPSALLRCEDFRVRLEGIDPALVAAVVEVATGSRPSRQMPDALAAALSLPDLCLGIRAGGSPDECLDRLEGLARSHDRPSQGSELRLEDLHGLGQARAWADALIRDLRQFKAGALAWDAVDRGALLCGPPGTGKTTMAAAVARAAGVPLVSSSGPRLLAPNFLGHVTKGIAELFAEARRRAPCILLIDEIDAFPDRSKVEPKHQDYWRGIVGALLEGLDGVEGREGVVAIATTNIPDVLDPALLRSGRLDRMVVIELPTAQELASIVAVRLGPDLPGTDLTHVGALLEGATGADCERLVRAARRTARLAGRELRLDDLLDAVRGSELASTPEELRRTAIHEAGHALAAVQLLEVTSVTASVARRGRSFGRTSIRRSDRWDLHGTVELRRELVWHLAGRAAEQVLLGRVSAGSGGSADSDLGTATRLAVRMAASLGLAGDDLLWLGEHLPVEHLSFFPDVLGTVRGLLDAAYEEALALVRSRRAALDALARELASQTILDDAAVRGVLARHPPGEPEEPSAPEASPTAGTPTPPVYGHGEVPER